MKTHWKKLTNPLYLGAYDFQPGEERNLKIKEVKRENVTGPDGKKEECTVAHLVNSKPIILNSTNSKRITKALNTPYIEDWAGKTITVYVEAGVRAFGEITDAIRIRPAAPITELPELKPGHAKWEGAMKAVQAGNTTIEAIRKSFRLSPENEELLLNSKAVSA